MAKKSPVVPPHSGVLGNYDLDSFRRCQKYVIDEPSQCTAHGLDALLDPHCSTQTRQIALRSATTLFDGLAIEEERPKEWLLQVTKGAALAGLALRSAAWHFNINSPRRRWTDRSTSQSDSLCTLATYP